MNFLYPLLLAGAAAVVVPILLHMIRRHTQQRLSFSSLMFLKPSAPRFRRRSKLEHWLLLLLRCAIICLLALALARPFWVLAQATTTPEVSQRWVILLDTSASMRRGDLWTQALQQARTSLDQIGPADRACVMTFDRDTHTLLGFDQWQQAGVQRGRDLAWEQLQSLSPTWNQTDLGAALMTAAEALEDDGVMSQSAQIGPRQVICISDMQQGASLAALRSYQWPSDVQVQLKSVQVQRPTNASLQWVADRDQPGQGAVRVTNSADAQNERFTLQWGTDANQVREVYVPAGFRVLVPGPFLSQQAGSIKLSGDDDDFDNTLYVAPQPPQVTRILYLGTDDPNNPSGLEFYLRQALGSDSRRRFRFTTSGPDSADIIVVCRPLADDLLQTVAARLNQGTPVWVILTSTDMAATLAALAQMTSLPVTEAKVTNYAMLGRLEINHPAMQLFADPRFGNFTRLHIWHYRQVDLSTWSGAQVMAWLDSGDPAWWSAPIEQGTLLVMAHGWQPADSDLALSSKFVPWVYSLLEFAGLLTEPVGQVMVGDPVTLKDNSTRVMETPGLYPMETQQGTRTVAVNLGPQEGRTAPYDLDNLVQAGLPLHVTPAVTASAQERLRQQQSFAAMESEQKLWRVILMIALMLLGAEIWLSGFLTRSRIGGTS